MANNKFGMQEKLNKLKDIRREIYENLKNQGVMVFNKVEYLGIGNRTKKELYRVIEEYLVDNKHEVKEVFYEFENGEFDLSASRRGKDFFPPEDYSDEEIVDEKWKSPLRDDIEELAKKRDKEFDEIIAKLGFEREDITRIDEIDLKQKIEEKEKQEEKKEHKQEENESQEISEEEIKKSGQTGLNDVNLNTSVDSKGTTLAEILNLKDYTKLMVVHSYKLAELTNSEGENGRNHIAEFGLIAQKLDGTYETIPRSKLDLYTGQNTNITKIGENGIETGKEECRFDVPGRDTSLVIHAKDPYNIPEVYLARNTPDNNGLIAEKLQDKYDGSEKTNVEVRALFNANKGTYFSKEAVKEATEQPHQGDCKMDLREVDGDSNTVSHLHEESNVNYHGREARFEMIAKIDGGCKTPEEIHELLEITNSKLEKEDLTPEEAIDNAIKERDNQIILESNDPQKVQEVMNMYHVGAKTAIEALEMSGWKNSDEVEDFVGRYKENKND